MALPLDPLSLPFSSGSSASLTRVRDRPGRRTIQSSSRSGTVSNLALTQNATLLIRERRLDGVPKTLITVAPRSLSLTKPRKMDPLSLRVKPQSVVLSPRLSLAQGCLPALLSHDIHPIYVRRSLIDLLPCQGHDLYHLPYRLGWQHMLKGR